MAQLYRQGIASSHNNGAWKTENWEKSNFQTNNNKMQAKMRTHAPTNPLANFLSKDLLRNIRKHTASASSSTDMWILRESQVSKEKPKETVKIVTGRTHATTPHANKQERKKRALASREWKNNETTRPNKRPVNLIKRFEVFGNLQITEQAEALRRRRGEIQDVK